MVVNLKRGSFVICKFKTPHLLAMALAFVFGPAVTWAHGEKANAAKCAAWAVDCAAHTKASASAEEFSSFRVKSWPRLVNFVEDEVEGVGENNSGEDDADPMVITLQQGFDYPAAPQHAGVQFTAAMHAQQNAARDALQSVATYFKENHDFLEKDFAQLGPLYKRVAVKLAQAQNKVGPTLGNNLLAQYGGPAIVDLMALPHNLSLTWAMPYDFGISFALQRTFSPALHSNGYLVTDKFKTTIEAQHLLGGLNEEGIIEIASDTLAAYAGVAFERTYTFTYEVANLQEAIFGHLDRLFLPFMLFGKSKILDIQNNEILSREDHLVTTAAAAATSQVYGTISASAASLMEYHQLSNIKIEGVGEDDHLVTLPHGVEQFRVEISKSKELSLGLSASMQIDLINLLRLTLIAVDYSAQIAQSKSLALRFSKADLTYLTAHVVHQELQKVFTDLAYESEALRDYFINYQEHTKLTQNLTYWLSLLGGGQQSSTEEIFILRDTLSKKYFRHEAISASYIQNPVSGLMTSLVKSVLKLNSKTANLAAAKKNITLEYESSYDRLAAHDTYDLAHEYGRMPASTPLTKRFYTSFKDDFSAYQTTGYFYHEVKKFGENLLQTYAANSDLSLEPTIQEIDQDQLRGPLTIHGEIKLYEEGVLYFVQQDPSFIAGMLPEICQAYPVKNKVLMGKSITRNKDWGPRKSCNIILKNRWQSFQKAWAKAVKQTGKQELQVIPLWELKNLLAALHVYIRDFHFYPELFGEENIFVQVRLTGYKAEGDHLTYTAITRQSGHYAGESASQDFAYQTGQPLPLHNLSATQEVVCRDDLAATQDDSRNPEENFGREP
ncbi:MAG: hypothetical protein J6Y94_01725, partial [Bacteriovoracaceae bacterium]|nr:hypothetical protein [Bacteriovoracaceae bacterium]